TRSRWSRPSKGVDRPTGRFYGSGCPLPVEDPMTLAPTSTDRGSETRRRILEVAAESFADRGYAGTSVNDVLKASGVTKGGFYFHFPSKEALALATLRHKQEQW